MGNFFSDMCRHSSTTPPFKPCSTTLLRIYGGIFYPKGSDFSTKPFSQNSQRPFAGYCHCRGITLPMENNRKISCSSYLILVDFQFSVLYIPGYSVPILFKSLQVWVFRNLALHGESDFSREIRVFHTCREFRSTREIFKAFYEAFMDLQNLHFCCREIERPMIDDDDCNVLSVKCMPACT